MKPTEKLYYRDSFLESFTAMVLSIEKTGDNFYEVVLDRTAFFPESGGQTGDTGFIAGSRVLDVHIKNDIILHKVEFHGDPGGLIGSKVPCRLDFAKRFSKMQQHTGEHIFSGIVDKLFGYENVGFHLSDNVVTMDYSGKLSGEDIQRIETLCNEAICKNIPVTAEFPSPEELNKLDYRSKLEASEMGDVRIVSIPDTDICACCAPHVLSTGQVGILKVTGFQSYKGGVRISILCGSRALEDYRTKQDILVNVGRSLSIHWDQLEEKIAGFRRELEDKNDLIRSLEDRILIHNISSLSEDDPVIFCEITDSVLLRNKVTDLSEERFPLLFAFNGNDEKGYNCLIAAKKDDAKEVLHRLSNLIDIKGGGSGRMVSGRTTAKESAIREALKQLRPV